jgi:hypothetical protein
LEKTRSNASIHHMLPFLERRRSMQQEAAIRIRGFENIRLSSFLFLFFLFLSHSLLLDALRVVVGRSAMSAATASMNAQILSVSVSSQKRGPFPEASVNAICLFIDLFFRFSVFRIRVLDRQCMYSICVDVVVILSYFFFFHRSLAFSSSYLHTRFLLQTKKKGKKSACATLLREPRQNADAQKKKTCKKECCDV